ncbi:MAG: RHS repeat-associated core domain-containing protein, partial [Pseudomonadota bacterium]
MATGERRPYLPEEDLYAYDGAGNTTDVTYRVSGFAQSGFSYLYNQANRLAEVRHGVPGAAQTTVGRYVYNALGQQVVRRNTAFGAEEKTISVHDLQGRRIAEYDKHPTTGALTLLREYLWLDGWTPFAVVEGGQVYFLAWDTIGRPVAAFDSLGQAVWKATYAPFGALETVEVDTNAIERPALRFPGQWFQAEHGLHQNWFRDYDPNTGRYLQADPLGLVDGPSVYGYAGQRPSKFLDPEGLRNWADIWCLTICGEV